LITPLAKSPYGFSVWIITCVSIGLGLAYMTGVSAQAILTVAVIIASGVTIALLGAWLSKPAKK